MNKIAKKIIVIIIAIICSEALFKININYSNAASSDIYDVILFWGQSNMVGRCGKEEYEKKPDTRYTYSNEASVNSYASKSGISKEFLSNSLRMNYVKIKQKSKTVYEYKYKSNSVSELNENTCIMGETLLYNPTSKKLGEASNGIASIYKSSGTNCIPAFCKTYYENTGHKVIAVFAANGGQKISNFLPSTDKDYGDTERKYIYEAMSTKYKAAISYMNSKGYKIGNKLWVCCQGEADVKITSTADYKSRFLKLHKKLKSDLGITKGAIIETSYTVGFDYLSGVKRIHNAQSQLISENKDIILGSSFSYNRYVPGKTDYESSSYNNKIYTDSNGNKMSYSNAIKLARYSTGYPDNIIHFTSAALSQMGKETAERLSDFSGPVISATKQSSATKSMKIKITVSDEGKSGLSSSNNYQYYLSTNSAKLTGGSWKTYTRGKEFTIGSGENGTRYLFVKMIKDNADNNSTGGTNVTIDSTKYHRLGTYVFDNKVPTLTVSYSTTNKTNGNVKATIKANEVVQSVSGWTLSSDKKSLIKTYTSNVSNQKVTVKDIAGNTSTATINISNIDKTAPTLNVSYSTTNKTNGNVKATIKANEVVQQVSGWTLSSDKKSLTKTYTSNVSNEKVTVKDTAGNTKTATINISNIDKTAPTLTVSYSTTNKTNGSVTATITANEVVQAVSGWTLSSDKKSLNKKYTSNVSNEKVTVKDTAGNTKTATINISNIDKVAPTITVSYSTTEATNGNVTATIKSNKEIQSVSGWTLSSDKKSLTKTYTSNVSNEKVIVKDIAGNASTATINISNIDKTAPKVTVNYSNRNKTKERVVVTITADEKIQEVEGWTLLMDQKNITKTFKENSKETITIKDIVGNKIEKTIEVNNIDKEAPIINVEYSNKDITNEDVTVRITANEEIQRIENWEQSEDRKTISKVYKENNSDEIIVKDIAGNEQPITVEVNNIDKVAPVLTVNYLALNKNKDEITATITANEEIEGIEGWTLSEDKRTISKTYEENKTEGITVKDKAGNSSKTTISVTTLNKRFEVEEYVIENNNIKDVPANMSFEEFAKNIDTNMEYEIRENGNRISNTSIVKTGQMLIVGNSVYTIIVKGDTNKDGKVDILDIMQINRHRLNKERLTGASLEAGDVNEDENVNITDIMRINMYRLRKISKL